VTTEIENVPSQPDTVPEIVSVTTHADTIPGIDSIQMSIYFFLYAL
jgi:hypothetical protein